MADGVAGRVELGIGEVELGDHGIERASHVGTGVAVWDRVDVEPIDALGMDFHRVAERDDRAAQCFGAEPFQRGHADRLGATPCYPDEGRRSAFTCESWVGSHRLRNRAPATRRATANMLQGNDIMNVQLRGAVRTRWAAIGAAVAISIGGGGIAITQAAVSSGPRSVFVPIAPCRCSIPDPATATSGPVAPHSGQARPTHSRSPASTETAQLRYPPRPPRSP